MKMDIERHAKIGIVVLSVCTFAVAYFYIIIG